MTVGSWGCHFSCWHVISATTRWPLRSMFNCFGLPHTLFSFSFLWATGNGISFYFMYTNAWIKSKHEKSPLVGCAYIATTVALCLDSYMKMVRVLDQTQFWHLSVLEWRSESEMSEHLLLSRENKIIESCPIRCWCSQRKLWGAGCIPFEGEVSFIRSRRRHWRQKAVSKCHREMHASLFFSRLLMIKYFQCQSILLAQPCPLTGWSLWKNYPGFLFGYFNPMFYCFLSQDKLGLFCRNYICSFFLSPFLKNDPHWQFLFFMVSGTIRVKPFTWNLKIIQRLAVSSAQLGPMR